MPRLLGRIKMTKNINRWAIKNVKTGAIVKSKTFGTRAEARQAKLRSSYPAVIFDTVNNKVVR